MWNVKAKAIPVPIWANGTISTSLRQYLSNVPAKHEIKKLPKNSHIVHCTLTAGSADVEVRNIFNMGNNITCSIQCKCKTAVIVYGLETWSVSGI